MTNQVQENAAVDELGASCDIECINKPVETITTEILSIFDYLSQNDQIVFKSQQINEPELNTNEKKLIALEIFNRSHKTFLLRFGKYLETKHLDDLKTFCLQGCDYDEDVDSILFELQRNLDKRKSNVKNRRYAAMKELMKEDEYFSEREMMKREPHLYEQLVGQYLTKSEKDIRDGFDPKNTPFSSVLMNNLENDRIEDLRKEQKREEALDEDSQLTDVSSTKTEYDSMTENEEMFPNVPPEFRKHWGSFDDNEESTHPSQDFHLAGSSSFKKKNKRNSDPKCITASEREMLRQEFMGIMHSKFIDGNDKDFDYSKIDDDSNLDDLKQINQDMEDEYFKDDDTLSRDIDKESNEKMEEEIDTCESDDDLDVYMSHLNHSINN